MGPVIAAPSGPLERALTTLDHGERWLVEPRRLDDSGRLWSPGVRIGVQPGSWFHRTECFGPVLGVIRADDLDHAVRDPERRRVRAHRRAAQPRRGRDRALAGSASRSATPTSTATPPAPSCDVSRSAGGSARPSGAAPRPAVRATSPASCRSTAPQRRTRRRRPRRTSGGGTSASAPPSTAPGLAAERNVLRYRPVAGVVVRIGPDDARARRRLAACRGPPGRRRR